MTLSWARPPLALPDGIDTAPGPTAVAAVRYTDSPVGPFLQLMVLVPARLGAHFGWSAVRGRGRQARRRRRPQPSSGIPASQGELRWFARDGVRQLLWEDRDLSVKARGAASACPWSMPHRQCRPAPTDRWSCPDRRWGLFRPGPRHHRGQPARRLDRLIGRHLGATVDGVHRTGRPARTPVGLLAPLRGPGPGPRAIPGLIDRVQLVEPDCGRALPLRLGATIVHPARRRVSGLELRDEFTIVNGHPNGGYLLAVLGRAALAAVGDPERHVVGATATYVSRAGGRARRSCAPRCCGGGAPRRRSAPPSSRTTASPSTW